MKYLKVLFIVSIIATIVRLPFLPALGWNYNQGNSLEYLYIVIALLCSGYYILRKLPKLLQIPMRPDFKDKNFDEYIVKFNDHLKNLELKFTPHNLEDHGDHDHCEFCGQKISNIDYKDSIQEAYLKEDSMDWVCENCFEKYLPEMQWKKG